MGLAAAVEADWNFACPDWEARLREGRSLVPELPIDQALGEKAVGIFNNLRLPDVPGHPTMADAAGDWFRDIVRTAFGSLDLATRERMVRKVFGLVPKKNSKTTGGAGIALTAALMNDRPNAELQMIGPTQEIASVAFDQAWGMIDADPEGYLPKRFLVRDHIKTIEDRLNGSELKIKTFDMKVATGSKPIFVLLDEIHLMAAMAFAQRVYGQIEGNMLANPESLLIAITTQSDRPPAGIFRQELLYARGVRDGLITNRVRTLPVLYEFPEAMQLDKSRPWANPDNWSMVLPNLGRSITIERLKDDFAAAQEKGEEEIRRWASQHLNVEIGLALHSDRWRGADYWPGAREPGLTLQALIDRCDVVVVGIDGGGLDDLLGLAVLGRDTKTRDWLLWSKAWVQAEVLELRKEIAPALRDFADDGDLVLCTAATQDIEEVADLVKLLDDAGVLAVQNSVGLDPVGVAALIEALTVRGITGEQMTGVPQGYRLAGAVWGAERKLKDGTLRHAGSRLMAWCVGNAKAEQKGNAVLITKEAAGKAKIDPLAAAFNAVQLMSRNPESPFGDLDEQLADAVVV